MDHELAKAYQTPAAAAEYASRHERTPSRRAVSRREGRIVAALLGPLPKDAKLLDLACGTGRLTCLLRNAGWNPLAMDLSLEMLDAGLAAQRLLNGQTLNASVFQLPFGDRSVDGCVCGRFFHHLSEKRERLAFLSELRRVVSGPIVISFWTRANAQWLRRRVKQLLGRRASARRAQRLFELKQELALAGLRLVTARPLCFLISETVYLLVVPEGIESQGGRG